MLVKKINADKKNREKLKMIKDEENKQKQILDDKEFKVREEISKQEALVL